MEGNTLEIIESLLDMEEQADRSVALDMLRERVNQLETTIAEQEKNIELKEASIQNLTARNNELFLRVDVSDSEEEEEEEEIQTIDEVLDDPELFEEE